MAGVPWQDLLAAVGLSIEKFKEMLAAAEAAVPGGQLADAQIQALVGQWLSAASWPGTLAEVLKAELLALRDPSVPKRDPADLA